MIRLQPVAALAFAAILSGSAQQATFRTELDIVSVNVSVKKGNNPVTGLTAEDFRLFDSAVRQNVQAVSIEDVPIDVTLFMDTSGSTAGTLDDQKAAVRKIAAMLRPVDRFRLLTIGHSVYMPVPWTNSGTPFDLDMTPVGGISLIFDAVAAALRHRPDLGRRHLVVAMTDDLDCGSIVKPALLLETAKRSEAVVHWIEMIGGNAVGAKARCYPERHRADQNFLKDVAESTGGSKHSHLFGADPARDFEKIFSEFRQSYVLTFTPTGVNRAGWHALRVEISKGKYTINSRPGYFGG